MVGTILKSNRKNTILSVQFQNLIEKNTTLSIQFQNLIEKYHTVGTIPKSNRKIPHCWYNSKI